MLKRIVSSIGAMIFGRTLTMVGNLLLVPAFLSHWDKNTYGEWMALSATVAYLSTTDLGVNTAAVNEMAAAYARQDLPRYRSVQSSASMFYLLLTAIGMLVIAAICALVPFSSWLGLRNIPLLTAALVTWLLAAKLMMQMLAGQVWGIYRSIGNLAGSEWIWNLQFLGVIAVTLFVLRAGGSPLHLALWGILPLLVITAFVWGMMRRSHPDLLPRPFEARLTDVRSIMRPSLGFGLIMLATAFAFNAPVLQVSGALGGAAVALLVSTRTLCNILRQLTAILTSAAWPELTRLHAVGANTELQRGHRVLCAASTACCTALAATLWFEGAPVIRAWTGGRLEPDALLLRLFLVALVLQTPWMASALVNMATNRTRRLAGSQCLSAILSVGATAALLPRLGLCSVPVGMILGEAAACYHFIVRDTCRAIATPYGDFARRTWTTVALTSAAALVAANLASRVAPGPVLLRAVQIAACAAAVSSVSAWRLGLTSPDRLWLSARILSVCRRQLTRMFVGPRLTAERASS